MGVRVKSPRFVFLFISGRKVPDNVRVTSLSIVNTDLSMKDQYQFFPSLSPNLLFRHSQKMRMFRSEERKSWVHGILLGGTRVELFSTKKALFPCAQLS